MNAYMYSAALYCEQCGEAIRARLDAEGFAPSDPDDETSYDSDEYPKGPFPDGGGEADCPQHCDDCHCFLENPLTSEGERYVLGLMRERPTEITALWADFYGLSLPTDDDDGEGE